MGIFDRFKKKKEDQAVKAAAVQAAKEQGAVEAKQDAPKEAPKIKKAETKAETKKPAAKKRSKPSVTNGVLVRPHVTEKTAQREAKGLYTFEVITSANKYTVANEIEHMFGVIPTRVRIINRQGKKKRFGRTVGHRKNRKYALVQLAKGKTISLHKGV